MEKYSFFQRAGLSVVALAVLATSFTGCSSLGEAQTTAPTETETVSDTLATEATESETETTAAESTQEESTSVDADIYETYPETVAAQEAAEDESPYFGIMHATILSVDEDSSTYTLVDKNDEEDSWTLTSTEIRAIETDMTEGIDVAVLFNGDIINDSDNVSFLVVLPDETYKIQSVTGTVTDNMMSTFTITGADGSELHFLKDGCKMDDGALDTEVSHEVTVYYVDAGDLGVYPVRIYL